MRYALKPHPDSRSSAVSGIEVEVLRHRPGSLILHYFVTGRIGDLFIPPLTPPERTDGLWKHTCFEAFVRAPDAATYYELNFSPSTRWAAYKFTGYRAGMNAASEIETPHIEVQTSTGAYEMRAALILAGLASELLWQLNLSAVIEETSGSKSYWALMHPPGKPDFHHSDCFALELATA